MSTNAKTKESMSGPKVPHFSVFLPNRVGALLELTKALAQANVHICGLDVIGAADSAVLRMVVDDPQTCRKILIEHSFAATESNALVVELPQGPEKLETVLCALLGAEINIEFTYPLMIRPHGKAVLVMHIQDEEFACDVMRRSGFTVLSQADIAR